MSPQPSRSTDERALTRRGRRKQDGPGARGQDRETRLLAIGERLVTEGTFNDTSISAIATEAGLSRPAFYFYFASKDELLAELVARTLARSNERWVEMMSGPITDPEETVGMVVKRSAEMWEDRPLVLSAAVELFARVPAIRKQWLQAIADAREPLADLIVRLTRLPENRDPSRARDLAEALIWMFERSFYIATYQGAGPKEYQELAKTITDAWVSAMGLRGEE